MSKTNRLTPELLAGLRVGVLGGSFNPPHAGHMEITEAARRRLRLDRCLWLVTPGNPLKDAGQYAPLPVRLDAAQRMGRGRPWLTVSDFEARHNLRYTADTLGELVRRFPRTKFVWLMGADSLASFDRWRDWRGIARTMPICVVNRPGYRGLSSASRAGHLLRRFEVPETAAQTLPGRDAPAWVYLSGVSNDLSSTALRSA